ncbi:integrase [Allostella sp. ATCC 35155]|nr:integrase [Stella sp. ATCC 35155]
MRKHPGQIGRYWLGRVAGSSVWYACWYDPGDRRVRRKSLRTGDDREAQERLAALALKQSRPRQADPGDVAVSIILDDYLANHIAGKPGAVTAAHNAEKILEHFGTMMVSGITPASVEAYIAQRRRARAHANRSGAKPGAKSRPISDATISRELSVLRAALRRAHKRGELQSVPHVGDLPKPGPRERWLTRPEAQRLIDAAKSDHFRLFLILALHTAARPGALLELTWFQVDLEHRNIDLNPAGRVQTKKRRPPIRMSMTLHAAFCEAERAAKEAVERAAAEGKHRPRSEFVIAYHGQPIASIKKAFRDACTTAGLTGVTPGTLRHTAATWMAQAGVPMWEIAGRLGHSTTRTTELYAKHSPDFQQASVDAMDRAFAPKFRASRGGKPVAGGPKSLKGMVGATGIEPVTPTMST